MKYYVQYTLKIVSVQQHLFHARFKDKSLSLKCFVLERTELKCCPAGNSIYSSSTITRKMETKIAMSWLILTKTGNLSFIYLSALCANTTNFQQNQRTQYIENAHRIFKKLFEYQYIHVCISVLLPVCKYRCIGIQNAKEKKKELNVKDV